MEVCPVAKQKEPLRYAIHWRKDRETNWLRDLNGKIAYFFSPDAAHQYADSHVPAGSTYMLVNQAQIRAVPNHKAY